MRGRFIKVRRAATVTLLLALALAGVAVTAATAWARHRADAAFDARAFTLRRELTRSRLDDVSICVENTGEGIFVQYGRYIRDNPSESFFDPSNVIPEGDDPLNGWINYDPEMASWASETAAVAPLKRYGLAYQHVESGRPDERVNGYTDFHKLLVAHWVLEVAGGLVSLLALLPLLARVRRAVRRRRRLARGLCPACGYDVRGSADRCSECGLSAGRTNAATTASHA